MPGQPEESLLIRAIQRQADVSAMPPEKEKALKPNQVADFAAWIKAGAVCPQRRRSLKPRSTGLSSQSKRSRRRAFKTVRGGRTALMRSFDQGKKLSE